MVHKTQMVEDLVSPGPPYVACGVRRGLGKIEKLVASNTLAEKCVIEQQGKLEFVMFSNYDSMISISYRFMY